MQIELNKIYADFRGEIWTVVIEDKEHTILTFYKGAVRGGCIHRRSDEYAVILKGSIEYHIRGKKTKVYKKGESVLIPVNCPHYLIALEDSVVLEWGLI